MKKVMFALALALAAGLAPAADEEVTLVVREIATLDVPFEIKSFMASARDVVRIEKMSGTALRLTGLAAGRCDLEVRGDLEAVQRYLIRVGGGDLPRTLEALQRELETVPEVRARILGDRIRLDGEIRSLRRWAYFEKVLKAYPGVRSFVTFWPNEDILLNLKASLQKDGFAVVFEPLVGAVETWRPNCVAIDFSRADRQVAVQARVYTPDQQAAVMSRFRRESRWLRIDEAGAGAQPFDEDRQLAGQFRVFVAKPQIRLSVAYLAVGRSDLQKIGNAAAVLNENGGVDLTGALNAFARAVSGHADNRQGAAASIAANLGFATRFFKQNGISTVSDTGYTTIESWSPAGARFKSGGTRYVRVSGHDAAGLEEVPYGFTINAKGGLSDEATMSAEFDFEMSTILTDGEDYDRREDHSKQKLTLPLGQTTIVSGLKDLVDSNTPPSGFPFLRSTPILNWFVADSGKNLSDRKLFILVCPEVVDNTLPGKLDPDGEINKPLAYYRDKTTDDVLEDDRQKRFSGFWYWLNWFTF